MLSGVLTFGATGAALALTGAGVPFLVSAVLMAAAAGVVMYAVLRRRPVADTSGEVGGEAGGEVGGEVAALAQLEAYRDYTAGLRHDIRGVLSPALMMSDRLLNHEDEGVQRAGQAVVRSVERATALLATHKDAMAAGPEAGAATPDAPAPPRR